MKEPPPRSSVLRSQAGRARRLAGRLGRRMHFAVSPPPIILCYHRVFEPERDPQLLSVSRENFRAQLEVVRRVGQPLGLEELSVALEQGNLPRRGVVFTFDDGYLDNFENALPLLRAAGIPATIYFTTGAIDADREFWWDDLERLTLGAEHLPELVRLEIDGRAFEWNLAGDTARARGWSVLDPPNERTPRQRLFCDLHAALRPLPASPQEQVLAQLRALTGTPAAARPSYRCLSAAELRPLAAEPLLTLGAHTISHCDLAFRTPPEQQAEIAGSKEQLERIIGRAVTHFSYPYGSQNDASVAACAASQLRSAVTCVPQPVDDKAPRFGLPRLLVRNWDAATFERQLKELVRG